MQAYFEKNTGEVWFLADDVVEAAEENNKDQIFSDFVEEQFEAAKRKIKSPDDFLEMPSQYEINEYGMMEDFCDSIKDEEKQDRAFFAIRGKGAFRRFKDLMHHLDLIEDWYKYRNEKIKQKAIEWCKDNDIEYEE